MSESTTALADILAWLDEKPTLSRQLSAARKLDARWAASPDVARRLDIAVVRNVTIEPIEPLLKVAGYRRGFSLHPTYSGYDIAAPDDLHEVLSNPVDVVLVLLRLDELAPALADDFLALDQRAARDLADDAVARVVDIARAARERSRARVLVHNFEAPRHLAAGIADPQSPLGQLNLVRHMNQELASACHALDGVHVLDLDHVLATVGYASCYDDRGSRAGDAPYALDALRALANAQVRHLEALGGARAKCIVVDCDNTLWGGVIGEDGIAGIALGETGPGRAYRDFQQRLLDLRRRGVLLAIASKNEETDVLDVLRDHPECRLRENDFAARRINWDDKASNIESIAKELNLALEHIVFIDDNPVECDWVSTRLPGLKVLLWPEDPAARAALLDELSIFDSLVVTDEDRERTAMYVAESNRRASIDPSATVEDHLRSLAMVATVGAATPAHLSRLAQLTQRTNQFNLTTRRYEVGELEALLDDPRAAIVWLALEDRFGPSGVVGCGIVRSDGDRAEIDTLLLSCRVLGRRVEAVLVERIARAAAALGATTLVGEYRPTARNAQVADLYGLLGFEQVGDDDGRTTWQRSLRSPFAVPDWFQVIEAGGTEVG